MLEGDWKLVHQIVPNKYELFDLNTDPEEENNLTTEFPEKYERMKNLLEAHLQNSGAQRMRAIPDWNPTQPRGKMRNYGIHYPAEGGIYPQVSDPYPDWFKQE